MQLLCKSIILPQCCCVIVLTKLNSGSATMTNNLIKDNDKLMLQLAALGIAESPLFDINELTTTPEFISLLEMMQLDATLDNNTKTLVTAALEAVDTSQ